MRPRLATLLHLQLLTKNIYSKNISTKLKLLGIYQIAGGAIGLALTIWLIAAQAVVSGLLLLVFSLALGLYSYSIYCGTLSLKQKNNSLTHSLINQYLQLISFSILGYGFQYVSGVFISAGIDLTKSTNLKLNFGISAWQININQNTDIITISINLVAVLLIIFIDKLRTKIAQERLDFELLQV